MLFMNLGFGSFQLQIVENIHPVATDQHFCGYHGVVENCVLFYVGFTEVLNFAV